MMRCCKHCGALLEDEAKVCDFCGAVLEVPQNVIPAPQEAPAVIPVPQVATETAAQPAKKKKLSKKTLFIVCGVLLAVIVIAVAFNILIPNPHVAVNQYKPLLNGEFDKLEELAPKEYWEQVAKNQKVTVQQYLETRIAYLEERYEKQTAVTNSSLGNFVSVDLKVVDAEKVKEKDLAGIKKALEETYGIDADRVKNAHKLIVKMTRIYTEDSHSVPISVSAVQIDSKWYLISYSKGSDNYRVSFVAESIALYYY